MGEPVELSPGGVALVDHGVVLTVAVGVPPAAEDVAVHVHVVADDVEVPGRFESVECIVDAPFA